jgi:flagellar motor switch protein FliM
MQRVLNQEEIDAIVQASRGLKSSAPKKEKSVQACDFRQAGQLSRELVQAVSGMYEGFARNLSQALGLYLPVAIQALLVSVEQLTYKDFLVRTPEITLRIVADGQQEGGAGRGRHSGRVPADGRVLRNCSWAHSPE